ncbi:hypothetical protein CBR_g31554 [Chara braunii]|uniref:RING-type domain-containing protein n=1 Tax=Chara braunii TaxID=69332 RepID=A0A388LFC0_CHABU|nr:hypothetical protein CBR_g31554 [Chara braunii]|eukprot:GBG80998.1 hypothetical protein CBR_g31554 [Chara braunii]
MASRGGGDTWRGSSSAVMENSGGMSRLEERLRALELNHGNLIIAFDFAARNLTAGRSSFGGRCLHAVNQGDPNPYMRSAAMIGRVVGDLSSKSARSVLLGFGASNQPVVFSIESSSTSPRCDLEPELWRYKEIAAQVTLGHSSFAAPIDAAMKIVQQDGFHVLIIVTCGRGSDLGAEAEESIMALKKASKYPLSIVFAVVGDGPCSGLHNLRMRLGVEASKESTIALSNITIVDFQEHFSKPHTIGEKQIRFASACLDALPDQYRSFRDRGILNCHQRTHAGTARVEIPPCRLQGEDNSNGGARSQLLSGGWATGYGPCSTTYYRASSARSSRDCSYGASGSGYSGADSSLGAKQRPNQSGSASLPRAHAASGGSRLVGAGPPFADDRLASPSSSAAGFSLHREGICDICFTAKAAAQFSDCPHRTCVSCAQQMRSWSKNRKMACPFCRAKVNGWKKLSI